MPKNVYYIDAKIEVRVTLHILADSESDALFRAKDGVWHNVVTHNFDNSKLLEVGAVIKGPGVNGK